MGLMFIFMSRPFVHTLLVRAAAYAALWPCCMLLISFPNIITSMWHL